jgi:hypothetical protein
MGRESPDAQLASIPFSQKVVSGVCGHAVPVAVRRDKATVVIIDV